MSYGRKKHWTPEEIAIFEVGLEIVRGVEHQIQEVIQQFKLNNPLIEIKYGFPAASRSKPWPYVIAFITSASGNRAERILNMDEETSGLLEFGDSPSIAVYPFNDRELMELSTFSKELTQLGLKVQPWRVFTKDGQVGMMQYRLKPFFTIEHGRVSRSFLNPIK